MNKYAAMQRLLMSVLLLLAAAARAGDIGVAAGGVPPDTRLDEWQRNISQTISDTVEYFDHFFGEDRIKDDNRSTRIQLRLGVKRDRLDEVTFKQELSTRLSLPRLQDRAQLFFDDLLDVEQPVETQKLENELRESEPDTGLRLIIRENERIRINADAGVRLGSDPQVFGRIRARRDIPFEIWELRLTQRVFWFSSDGVGEDSAMEWSRNLGNGALVRSSTKLTWKEDEPNVTPAQAFSYYRAISPRLSFRDVLRAAWPESPHTHRAVYANEFTFRRRLHSDWLFVELTPGLEWRQEDSFGWNPFVLLILEIDFETAPPR